MTDSPVSPNEPRLTRPSFEQVRRVVVKVGSGVIAAGGTVSAAVLGRLARDVVELRDAGCEVVMVVSGAVAAGYQPLGLSAPPDQVVLRQAAASIGQPRLMASIGDAFGEQQVATAQLLLSADDVEDRRRFLSARHTLQTLVGSGVVPIINENDALSDDEIKVGDNDHLAALVTSLVNAELLIVLSTVDGVRRDGGKGELLTVLRDLQEVEHHISSERSSIGVGGMQAKLAAARLAQEAGVATVIADGSLPGALLKIYQGEDVGTLIQPPAGEPRSLRQRWIWVRSRSRGALQLNADACRRLAQGGAVSPQDVLAVDGDFAIGARVEIRDPDGTGLAFGLVSYGANEIRLMRGRAPEDFEPVLGYRYVDEIVQAEDVVLFQDMKVQS